MNDTTYIYGLLNPLTNKIFCVGRSADMKKRIPAHMRSKSNPLRTAVIDRLGEFGLLPSVVILDSVSGRKFSGTSRLENRWINSLIDSGHELTNVMFSPRGEKAKRVKRLNRKKVYGQLAA